MGLNTFIAAIGITSGPVFVEGLEKSGADLFLAGVVVTLLPLIVGILMGNYLFMMHPAIVLGACAGTVTYAIGNTLLTIWGVVIVAMMS